MMGYGMQAYPGMAATPAVAAGGVPAMAYAGGFNGTYGATASLLPGQAQTMPAQAQAMPAQAQTMPAQPQAVEAMPSPAPSAAQGQPAAELPAGYGTPLVTPDAISAPEALTVSGCAHETVGPIANGDYTKISENHGKAVYKKDVQVNSLDILMYFWDERDGPNFCGWYFGPKVGGDQVWAHHPSRDSIPPQGGSEPGPTGGWCVPFGGAVDAAFRVTPRAKAQQQPAAAQPAAAQAGLPQQAGMMQGTAPQGGGMQPAMQPALQQQPMQQPGMQQVGMQQAMAQPQQQQLSPQVAQMLTTQLAAIPGFLMQPPVIQQQLMQQMLMSPGFQAQIQAQQLLQQQQQLIQQQQLAEIQRRKEEEQKRRQELMRQKQEENQRKIEEMRKKMAMEQQACNLVLRTIQRVKVSTPDNFEEMKKELEKVMEEEGSKCGSQLVRMKAESERALVMAKNSVDKITEHRRILKEKADAEERLRNEIREKTTKLLEELRALIKQAEDQCKQCRDSAQPLVEGGRGLPDEEVENAVKAVDTSCTEAENMTKKCTAFILERGPELKSLGPGSPTAVHGQPSEIHQVLAKLLQQIKELAVISQQVQQIARTSDSRLKRRKTARAAKESIEEIFDRYDKDGDGEMSKAEAVEYAKVEFGFAVPQETIDFVWRHNVDEDEGVGLKKEYFRWLQVAVGIAREHARDIIRQQERDKRDEFIAQLKVGLQDRMKEAAQVVTDAEPVILEMEKKVEPIQKSSKNMPAADMVRLADETDEIINEGKSAASNARKSLLALLDDIPEGCKPDIQEYLLQELKLSEAKMGRIEMRLERVNMFAKRWRQTAAEKVGAGDALKAALENQDASVDELGKAIKRAEAANCDVEEVNRAKEEMDKRRAAQLMKLAAEAAARRKAAEEEIARQAQEAETARLAAEDERQKAEAEAKERAEFEALADANQASISPLDGSALEPLVGTTTASSEPTQTDAAQVDAYLHQPTEHAAADQSSAVQEPAADSSVAPSGAATAEAMDVDSPVGPAAVPGSADVSMADATTSQPATNAPSAVSAAGMTLGAVLAAPPTTSLATVLTTPPAGVPTPPPAVLPAGAPVPALVPPRTVEAPPQLAPPPALPHAAMLPPMVAAREGTMQAKMADAAGDTSMEASWALFNEEVKGISIDASRTPTAP